MKITVGNFSSVFFLFFSFFLFYTFLKTQQCYKLIVYGSQLMSWNFSEIEGTQLKCVKNWNGKVLKVTLSWLCICEAYYDAVKWKLSKHIQPLWRKEKKRHLFELQDTWICCCNCIVMEMKQVTNSTQLPHMTSLCKYKTLKSNFKNFPFHINFFKPADLVILQMRI